MGADDMSHASRWIVLSLLLLLVHLPWWASAWGQRDDGSEPMPAPRATTHHGATGSGYPAPRVDESADPAPMSPTF
jgi:hypothetical protein